MVHAALTRIFRLLGRRYLRLALLVQFSFSSVVVLGGCGLLTAFADVDPGEFGRIVAVAEGLVLLENVAAFFLVGKLLRPVDPWLRGERTPAAAVRAWTALVGLPLDFFQHLRALPAVANVAPVSAYIAWELDDGWWPELLLYLAGSAVVLLYGALLRFFAIEVITRPVVEAIAPDLPQDEELTARSITVRGRLLLVLPASTLISGVVVSGLAGGALGPSVVFAIGVAATLVFELSLLLAGSIAGPLRALRRGTDAVARGDLSVRVPVTTSDEVGRLATSFNAMVAGLQEREQLQEALGAYVDPMVAQRVLEEGTELQGEEVEVSVMFLDIRDFTAFAERSTARQVVHTLNGFYEQVVPVLVRHGGHANKYVGDGLLAIFGAPDHQPDHADRAVAAALEIAELVRDRYGDELRIGVGVNSGTVVAGTIGGGGHVEFTVIGDPVNTAARVEQATRETGDVVLVTGETCRRVTRDHGGFEDRPPVELKGKSEPVTLHAPRRVARLNPVQVASASAWPTSP